MAKERRLGRGLEALLGRIPTAAGSDPTPEINRVQSPPPPPDSQFGEAGKRAQNCDSTIGSPSEQNRPQAATVESVGAPSGAGAPHLRAAAEARISGEFSPIDRGIPTVQIHSGSPSLQARESGQHSGGEHSGGSLPAGQNQPQVAITHQRVERVEDRPRPSTDSARTKESGVLSIQGAHENIAPGLNPQVPTSADLGSGNGVALSGNQVAEIPVDQVETNPFQPRSNFEDPELNSLVDSLRAHGLLQPIVVRRCGSRYQLVAGERRLRAAMKAGWTRVPAQIIVANERESAELAIVENFHRKDLNPLEKAAAFQRYLRDFGATQEELASRLKIDRSTLANLIRLLDLPPEVQQSLRSGKISQAHARALLPLEDEAEQVGFCRRIQKENLTVRQVESLVQEAIRASESDRPRLLAAEAPPRATRSRSEHLMSLEQEFRVALGTNVQITHNSRGRGKLIIHFRNHEEFERIRRQICDSPGSIRHAKAG